MRALNPNLNELQYSQFEEWLEYKAREFHDLGYLNVTAEDLWEYVTTFLWKRQLPTRYFEQVHDIMEIRTNDFFTFVSLDAQVYNVTTLDEMNIEELF
ncbi:post-transcriptional regulator [Allofustis seminis]|uniref:post-transcriptional regulator n=1 Tax=Allofustis seminis TaxID=166939 RepID=UPI0003749F9D|nr:post-transcriptional regulator [Allofustis seminis]